MLKFCELIGLPSSIARGNNTTFSSLAGLLATSEFHHIVLHADSFGFEHELFGDSGLTLLLLLLVLRLIFVLVVVLVLLR